MVVGARHHSGDRSNLVPEHTLVERSLSDWRSKATTGRVVLVGVCRSLVRVLLQPNQFRGREHSHFGAFCARKRIYLLSVWILA